MQQDSVAVGRGTRRLGGGDHAAGTPDVFDHDRLAQRMLHRLMDDSRNRVIGTAGRECYHQGNGPIGIVCAKAALTQMHVQTSEAASALTILMALPPGGARCFWPAAREDSTDGLIILPYSL